MDEVIGGFKNGECFLLMAKSGAGKTVLNNLGVVQPKKEPEKKQNAWLLFDHKKLENKLHVEK